MADKNNRVTLWADTDFLDRMDDRIEWAPPANGSRSAYMREAVRLRMVVEDALDREGIELPEDQREREAYLRDVAQAGIDAVGAPDEK
ncbi:MAG: hypothetical protein ACLFSD_00020 [Salinivenus sp.]